MTPDPPQYQILHNGEKFAYTRPPFSPDDAEYCRVVVEMAMAGRLWVRDGQATLVNGNQSDLEALDAIEFEEKVEQLSLIMSHPSLAMTQPNTDSWTTHRL